MQLDTDVPNSIQVGKNLIYQGKDTPVIGGQVSAMTDSFFGPKLFSEACQSNWKPCFQDWLATQIGVTRGDQYLLNMIQGTFEHGEIFLGVLIFAFSILFPISKNLLGILITMSSVKSKQVAYSWLSKTGKWSMTDVFVVALLILFFKAESIHLYMEAKTGVFLFALSAIFSSLGSHKLGSELGARLVFDTSEASIPVQKEENDLWDDF